MQEGDENKPINSVFNGFPEWEIEALKKQGFDNLDLPMLQRIGIDENGYNVYTSETECHPIMAESAYLAMKNDDIGEPLKITNINCRMSDIIPNEKLETISENNKSETESSEQSNPEDDKETPAE